MRTILLVLVILVFFLFSLILFPVTWLIGKKFPAAQEKTERTVLKGIIRFALFLSGTKVTVIGLENVPKDRPVLYVPNHRSYYDILLLYRSVTGPTGFLAKKEVGKVPVLNLWLKRIHGLLLDREDVRSGLKTILEAIDLVKGGTSMVVFAEGTRGKSPDDTDLAPLHEGSFKISTKSGCPIIPVAITGSSAILEDHFPWVRSAKVIVEYGEPIDPASLEGDNKKFPGRYVHGIIEEMLIKNRKSLTGN